ATSAWRQARRASAPRRPPTPRTPRGSAAARSRTPRPSAPRRRSTPARWSGDPTRASESLDPGAKLDLPGPGAARLLHDMAVAGRDRVGIEHAVGLVRGLGAARIADAAVDHEMRDMDALR